MRKKLPEIEHVKFVRRGDKVYPYFNTGAKKDGKPIRVPLPQLSAPNFWDTYAALKAGRTKRSVPQLTVGALIDEYQRSPDFREKADNTQRLYRAMMTKIRENWGKFPVNDLHPSDVRAVLDVETWGAGTHNMVLAALGVLYAWARPRGKTSGEPTKDIPRRKGGEHDPWPEDILEAALQAEDDEIRLAVHVLYFTGLRIGDALALRWGDIRDETIHVTPTKTRRFGKRLFIPISTELAAELAKTARKGITVLHGSEERKLREKLKAFTVALGVDTVPHGLRKNAVIALLLAGCTIAETAAITGQTYQVVEHYAAQVNTRLLGKAAIIKLDERRAKTRTGNTSGKQAR